MSTAIYILKAYLNVYIAVNTYPTIATIVPTNDKALPAAKMSEEPVPTPPIKLAVRDAIEKNIPTIINTSGIIIFNNNLPVRLQALLKFCHPNIKKS